MADRKPILVRFEGDWLLSKVDEYAAGAGLSRNAAILHLLTVSLAAEAPPEAAGSPGMISGPGGSLNGRASSAATEAQVPGDARRGGSGQAVAAEGASQAAVSLLPRGSAGGTEAPFQCVHGRASGEFCYPCGGRV